MCRENGRCRFCNEKCGGDVCSECMFSFTEDVPSALLFNKTNKNNPAFKDYTKRLLKKDLKKCLEVCHGINYPMP